MEDVLYTRVFFLGGGGGGGKFDIMWHSVIPCCDWLKGRTLEDRPLAPCLNHRFVSFSCYFTLPLLQPLKSQRVNILTSRGFKLPGHVCNCSQC